MRPIVRSGGRPCSLSRLVQVLPGSLWLVGCGMPVVEGAVFWSNVTPGGSKPGRRHGHGLAYDTAHDTLVLFGGTPAWTQDSFQDTWVYDDDNPVRQGYWTINACRGQPSGTIEPCYWHYRYDRNRCTPEPCRKLVVFFSTGLQLCDAPETFTATQSKGKILQAYAADDSYVAVCANTFLTGEGAGGSPLQRRR